MKIKFDFTQEEIDYMKKTANPHYALSPVWKRAFMYYNLNTRQHLGRGCAPCYAKVLNYILIQKINYI